MYRGHRTIATQEEFNQAVSAVLYDIYGLTVTGPASIAAGEVHAEAVAQATDVRVRGELANIQNYAWRERHAFLKANPDVVRAELDALSLAEQAPPT